MKEQDPMYNHLIRTFLNLYYRLEIFKEELETTHQVEEVRRKVANELKRVNTVLGECKGGISSATRTDAFYVMVAFTDETMIHSQYDGDVRWEDSPLEEDFCFSHIAGKRIFKDIDECIKNYSDTDLGMVALYFLIIALGFRGEHRFKSQGLLESLQKGLYRLIYTTDPSFPKESRRLFPEAYTSNRTIIEQEPAINSIFHYFFVLLIISICAFLVFSPLYSIYDVAFLAEYLADMPDQVNSLRELAWENRMFVAFSVLLILLVLLLYRICIYSLTSISSILFIRFSLGKLFTLLRSDLQGISKISTHRYAPSRFLFIACDEEISKDSGKFPVHQRHLIRQSGISIQRSHTVEIEPTKQQFCGYSIFDQTIIVDIPLMQESRFACFLFLKGLLRKLMKLGKGSALHGIILSIPFQRFLDTGDNKENDEALRQKLLGDLYYQIRFIQQQIKINLPVYLLISGCDQLEGFASFAQAIPEEYRDQMLGWSRTDMHPGYGDENNILNVLPYIRKRTLQVLFFLFSSSRGDDVHHQLMKFFKHFISVESQLSELITGLSNKSRTLNGEGVLLRGVYFSGIERQTSKKEHALFLASLLQDKVFAEAGTHIPYKPSLYERASSIWQTYRGEAS